MNRRALTLLGALLCSWNVLAGEPATSSLNERLAQDPRLSTFKQLLDANGLTASLDGEGPWTVFAPSNEAFAALPDKLRDNWRQDKSALIALLGYHLLPGKLVAAEVKNESLKSAQGAPLALSRAGDFITVEDAVVTTADTGARNGVIHIVDRVLMPPQKK